MGLFEYLTLSHVSEAPEQRLHMGELAYLVEAAAPEHLRSVRARILDQLDADDLAALTAVAAELGTV